MYFFRCLDSLQAQAGDTEKEMVALSKSLWNYQKLCEK